MNLLMTLFNETIGLIIGTIIFCLLSYIVETSDPESGLHKFTKPEVLFYYLLLTLSSLITNARFTSVFDRIFFMILLSVLLFHAHTDSKTNQVYRIFSLFLWIIGFIYTIVRIFIFKCIIINTTNLLIFLIGPTVFIIAMFFTSVLSGWLHGKGDGYILIANALFVQFLAIKPGMLTIEPILIHYIIAALILIISNPHKISFKKAKMKERVAYAPSVFVGTLLTMIITGLL